MTEWRLERSCSSSNTWFDMGLRFDSEPTMAVCMKHADKRSVPVRLAKWVDGHRMDVEPVYSVKVARILREAARLVRKGWTQGAAARTADGREVDTRNPQAACWCATAAMGRAAHNLRLYPLWIDAENKFRAVVGQYIVAWNDKEGRTAEEVAVSFERCAERIEGEAA